MVGGGGQRESQLGLQRKKRRKRKKEKKQKRTAERPLVGNLLAALDGPDLVKGADIWGKSTMNTQDSAIDHLKDSKRKKRKNQKNEKNDK